MKSRFIASRRSVINTRDLPRNFKIRSSLVFIMVLGLSPLTVAAKDSAPKLSDGDAIFIRPGYVTKLKCQGKLLVSAIGNADWVQLEPYPKELGCGVILKPLVSQARTNILLETSNGTVSRIIEIKQSSGTPTAAELTVLVQQAGG